MATTVARRLALGRWHAFVARADGLGGVGAQVAWTIRSSAHARRSETCWLIDCSIPAAATTATRSCWANGCVRTSSQPASRWSHWPAKNRRSADRTFDAIPDRRADQRNDADLAELRPARTGGSRSDCPIMPVDGLKSRYDRSPFVAMHRRWLWPCLSLAAQGNATARYLTNSQPQRKHKLMSPTTESPKPQGAESQDSGNRRDAVDRHGRSCRRRWLPLVRETMAVAEASRIYRAETSDTTVRLRKTIRDGLVGDRRSNRRTSAASACCSSRIWSSRRDCRRK